MIPRAAAIAHKAAQLSRYGLTDAQIAEFFNVAPSTLAGWKREDKDFREAMAAALEDKVANVAASLYFRAIGYSHESVKIMQYEGEPVIVPYTEHYPPDPVSCIFFLKNRAPEQWRDKVEHEGTVKHEHELVERLHAGRARALKLVG